MYFPTPTWTMSQTGEILAPTVTQVNNVDVLTYPAAGAGTSTPCSIQERSGVNALAFQRFAGQRVAVGYFPPELTLVKDFRVIVTGDGYPSAGRVYQATSPPTNSAGTGSFWIVNLEAVE